VKGVRKLQIRKVPRDPISEVHESEEYEIPGNEGRPDILILRMKKARNHRRLDEDHLLELRDRVYEMGMERPVLCVLLEEDQEIEVWEVED